jgi:hypothetical protein
MRLAEELESFLKTRVDLNQSRLDSLQQRVANIEEFVASRDDFASLFVATIPAGSWAARTIIKPVGPNDSFDADVLLQLNPQSGCQPKDYIDRLYDAFRASERYKALARKKTRCVRIDYANEFHIDLVPYLESQRRGYVTNCEVPVGKGRYEPSDPQAFTAWIAEREVATNNHFVHAVRLIKYLRDYKDTFTCKSIILLTLLGQQIDLNTSQANPAKYADVSSTLKELLTSLALALPMEMPSILAPDGSDDDLSARYRTDWDYTNFRTAIIRYAGWVNAAYVSPDRVASITAWQEMFGPEFSPDTTKKLTEIAPYRASVPWRGEQFIDRAPFNLPIQLDPRVRVTVTGKCVGATFGTGRRGFRTFSLASTNAQIPPHRKLRFTAEVSGVAPDAIYWKVRNGGATAAKAGKLRGEITKDGGVLTKEEPTLYPGTHYVECYVVKSGAVVATGRQAVVINK